MKTPITFKFACIILFAGLIFISNCSGKKETEALADFSWSIKDKKVQFYNQSFDAQLYSWNFGDSINPGTSSEMNPVHQYSETGTYWVSLSVDGDNGKDQVKKMIEIADQQGLIDIDGDFDDWSDIKDFKPTENVPEQGIIQVKVYATKQQIYVYMRIEKSYLTGYLSTYIDYDQAVTTGFKPSYANAGFEVLSQVKISDQDGDLFSFKGTPGTSEWKWNEELSKGSGLYVWSNQKIDENSAQFEFALNRSLMSGIGNSFVGLFFVLQDVNWQTQGILPSSGNNALQLDLKTGSSMLPVK